MKLKELKFELELSIPKSEKKFKKLVAEWNLTNQTENGQPLVLNSFIINASFTVSMTVECKNTTKLNSHPSPAWRVEGG